MRDRMFGMGLLMRRGGGFAPDDIDGLQLWLEASPTNTGAVEGGTIQTWTDLSANAFDATQATEAKRPTLQLVNGVWVVRFDGTDDTLGTSFTLAQPSTLVGIYMTNNTGNGQSFFGANGNAWLRKNASENFTQFAGSSITSAANTVVLGQYHFLSAVYNGVSSFFEIDGVEVASGDVGANSFINPFVAPEIASIFPAIDTPVVLLYDSELSDSDREALENCYGSTVTELNG